jgi:hypothetical protein
MKRQFVVTLDMPKGVTADEMATYIEESVAVWKGHMDPDEPLFDLDGDSVRAKAVPRKRPAKSKR